MGWCRLIYFHVLPYCLEHKVCLSELFRRCQSPVKNIPRCKLVVMTIVQRDPFDGEQQKHCRFWISKIQKNVIPMYKLIKADTLPLDCRLH